MNIGQLKKILKSLKDDTPIKVITKGVRPYHQGGGESVDITHANPCYNQDKPSEVWLHLYTNPPTEKIKVPREGWAEEFKKAEFETEKSEIEEAIWLKLVLQDTINNRIDLPFSACTGEGCSNRKECRRYLLFENISDGNTCIVPQFPCNSFLPIAGLKEKPPS